MATCGQVWTPRKGISLFLLIAVFFIPIGISCLMASRQVVEIVYRYDSVCIPSTHRPVEYIKSPTTNKTCNITIEVTKKMKQPIFIYYQLDKFHQNHLRYVRSRNDEQLISRDAGNHTKGCSPETTIVRDGKEVPIVPCGLISWSLFNDTYTFSNGADTLFINKTNIAWKSDKKKFGKDVYPKHLQAGDLQGGAKLNDKIPLNQQEDLMVWMRTAAFPTFRKLYGRIEQDLERNDTITVVIKNNYDTYSFGGTKKLVLSTTTFIGGKNDFLGISFIVVGAIYLLLAVAIIVMQQLYNPLRDMEAHR